MVTNIPPYGAFAITGTDITGQDDLRLPVYGAKIICGQLSPTLGNQAVTHGFEYGFLSQC
jgi:hypothetical protein